ncbi:MAG: molybdopterin-binding protein [Trueperaceae bacterium]|nr:molybdopterin-binding protein [Trueperaceae bacterium]
MIRTALLTVSDRGAGGPAEDRTVQAIREVLAGGSFVEVDYQVVPGEQARIRAKLRVLTENADVDLVLTVGGVGLAPRDRLPEAMAEVAERQVPGLVAAMQAAATRIDPLAALARLAVAVRRDTLVVNLPETADAARAALATIAGVLPTACEDLLRRSLLVDASGDVPGDAPGDAAGAPGRSGAEDPTGAASEADAPSLGRPTRRTGR